MSLTIDLEYLIIHFTIKNKVIIEERSKCLT